jgi:C4-dicarboxylate-specific signal transduction histidine kinase
MEGEVDAVRRGVLESLIAGITHDLNGRLTALSGVAYMARSGSRLDDELLEILENQVARLDESIRLLRALPLGAGKEAEPVRLRDVVGEATRLYGARSGPEPPQVDVNGDPATIVEAPVPVLTEILLLLLAAAEPPSATRAGKLAVRYGTTGADAFIVVTAAGVNDAASTAAEGGGWRAADPAKAMDAAAALLPRVGGRIERHSPAPGTPEVEIRLPAASD